jgi:hypothetical protein
MIKLKILKGLKSLKIIQFNNIYILDEEIIDILLVDRNTKKNIIFATDIYVKRGYKLSDEILSNALNNRKKPLIRTRIEKSSDEQKYRSKDKAEVFTPSWVCNKQNNLIDNSWFGQENVFNREHSNGWITNKGKINFNFYKKNFEDYIFDTRMEIACGEAPYLTSRYDTVTGDEISLHDRIGLLDRKFRVLNENYISKEEWIRLAIESYKAIYGYEYQGDSLFIARENLLLTFIDYFKSTFNQDPKIELLKEIATIISYNLIQMDGLKFVVPLSCKNIKSTQIVTTNLFNEEIVSGDDEKMCYGCSSNNIYNHNGNYCLIMDWKKNKKIKFIELFKGE